MDISMTSSSRMPPGLEEDTQSVQQHAHWSSIEFSADTQLMHGETLKERLQREDRQLQGQSAPLQEIDKLCEKLDALRKELDLDRAARHPGTQGEPNQEWVRKILENPSLQKKALDALCNDQGRCEEALKLLCKDPSRQEKALQVLEDKLRPGLLKREAEAREKIRKKIAQQTHQVALTQARREFRGQW